MNAASHAVGFILGLIGCALLLRAAVEGGKASQIIGCAVYSLTLLSTYAASTLSHALHGPRTRRAMRIADQACIFLFIAGTWVPIAVTWLRSPIWWPFHGLVCGIALYGFLAKVVFAHRVAAGSVTTRLQVCLGCLPVLMGWPLAHVLPAPLTVGIAAGGACYLLGVIFFLLDARVIFFHGLWHLLVLAGSAVHFASIYRFCTSIAG